MPDLLLIVLGTVLVNHFVLGGLAGIDSARSSGKPFAAATEVALSTGIVMLITAAVSLGAQHWVLAPLAADHLRLLVVVAVASAAAWLLPLCFARLPERPQLIVANGIVLVLGLQNAISERSLLAGAAISLSLAVAFGILLLAFTELLQRMEQADVPQPFRGAPIAFITAGLAALALLGLTGLLPG